MTRTGEEGPDVNLFLDVVNQPIYLENITDDVVLDIVENNVVIFIMRPIISDYDSYN